MTLKRILVVLALAAVCAPSFAQNDPVANPKAMVQSGHARFTVLTDRLVRMEWAEDGQFEDRASLAIVNRNLPVPEFKTSKSGGRLTIRTRALTLTYTGDGKFCEDNLKVTFKMATGGKTRKVVWYPGADDSANLMGTLRTLDGCEGFSRPTGKSDEYEKGVVSRDGWAVVDESTREVFQIDDSRWGEWVAKRPEGDRQDLYIFAYGHDYKAAVRDYTLIAGQIPLPPKYVFGYWWSRYWQYSDFEFINLAKEIRSHGIPIDVMVVDMDWHDTFTLNRDGKKWMRDEFGERVGWTGYTWQKHLFPDPKKFLSDLHALNLKTSLNLHPASGIQPYEECYERFVADYTSRTSDYDGPKGYVYAEGDSTIFLRSKPKYRQHTTHHAGDKCPVPFRISQKEWADAYFGSVIHPLQEQGVDFWWLDWQQWKTSEYVPGLSITFWLNRCFFDDRKSDDIRADRPLIYHRWGGMGSHRYQIGFSGDAFDTWDVLAFLPYFTSTSSNVGYGYWGHDIGGHQYHRGDNPYKPETYTRWLQYGVFTPIFKTHCTKSALIERRVWTYAPEYSNPMREAIRLRYSLSPYIYTAARQAFDTGISICRPMYYDWPEDDRAYDMKEQYMFGDDILASVICSPVADSTGLAQRSVWLPGGQDWYDVAHGKLLKGGQVTQLSYTINENPWFVKAGAIVPMASETISSLQEKSSDLTVFVAPGDGRSEYTLYEDDNCSQAYGTEFACTRFSKSSDASHMELTVHPRQGSYAGMPDARDMKFVFEGVVPAASVCVNGREAEYGKDWTYDGADLAIVLKVQAVSPDEATVVSIRYDGSIDRAIVDGKKGLFRRMMSITPEVKDCFNGIDPYKLISREFLKLAQCSSRITADPWKMAEFVADYDVERMAADFAHEVEITPHEEVKAPATEFFKKVISQTRQ